MTIYGYARVSTKEQNEDRQIIAMQGVGVLRENIYVDKQSGKTFNRPSYRELLEKLEPGDLLYIKSIDRLGRNYRDILDQWRMLTGEKSVDICVIDMPMLDTRIGKDLMGMFQADSILQLMSFVAENERLNIHQRQEEGIAAARMRGVRFGRPSAPLPDNFPDVYQRWEAGEISAMAAARECDMPPSSFRYRAKKYRETLSEAEPGCGTEAVPVPVSASVSETVSD